MVKSDRSVYVDDAEWAQGLNHVGGNKLKARNGKGSGMQFAADFVSGNLTLNEFGLIKK